MVQKVILSLFFLLSFTPAVFAQVTCALDGPSPNPVDPTLAPKVIAWVAKVESKVGLTAANWQGAPAQAATPAESSALELQSLAADWADAAQPGTVDSFFREAVEHGVNVQYETLMITADPGQAETHQFWADTEAARANACLAIINQSIN